MSNKSKTNSASSKSISYRDAGVDIEQKYQALEDSKAMIKSTWTRGVMGEIGGFGGLFRIEPGTYMDPVLVSSADGVGTKIQVATLAKKHNTVGHDLVNHCVNDILVQGAKPLFFLDYIGAGIIERGLVPEIIQGLAEGCKENHCALIGGETAEMPGVYKPGDYDLVGFIVGAVEREQVVTGEKIQEGDHLLGLPSTGLHTNGYSLARKIFFEKMGLGINDKIPGLTQTVADGLLAIHRSYYPVVYPLLNQFEIHAMAHITGGGLPDNLPRVFPKGLSARIDVNAWSIPQIFQVMQQGGNVAEEEMYRVFNMGIGYVLIAAPKEISSLQKHLQAQGVVSYRIGAMVPGSAGVILQK